MKIENISENITHLQTDNIFKDWILENSCPLRERPGCFSAKPVDSTAVSKFDMELTYGPDGVVSEHYGHATIQRHPIV